MRIHKIVSTSKDGSKAQIIVRTENGMSTVHAKRVGDEWETRNPNRFAVEQREKAVREEFEKRSYVDMRFAHLKRVILSEGASDEDIDRTCSGFLTAGRELRKAQFTRRDAEDKIPLVVRLAA